MSKGLSSMDPREQKEAISRRLKKQDRRFRLYSRPRVSNCGQLSLKMANNEPITVSVRGK